MNRLLELLLPRMRVHAALRDLTEKMSRIENRMVIVMAKLDDLKAAIARNHDAENSVIELLKGISQQLKDAQAGGDPAALDAVIAEIEASTERLAAAVVENTSTPT